MKYLDQMSVILGRALAGVLLAGLAAASSANPLWHESNNLTSTLDNNWTYASNAGTRTATVSFTNQQATNTSATSRHLGMYLGWAWSYDTAGVATSLPWSNADLAFSGGGVTLAVGGATGSLLLSSVIGDTWIGNPWGPGFGEVPIATVGSWDVPLFDFGEIAAGASVVYNISLNFAFTTQAAFDDWDSGGSFYVGGQGVEQIPEPTSLALVGLALAGLSLSRRRPKA